MALAHVQSKRGQGTTTVVTTFDNTTVSGNMIVVQIAVRVLWNSVISISDNKGNTFLDGQHDEHSSNNIQHFWHYYVPNCVGGAAHAITVVVGNTVGEDAANVTVHIHEASGVALSSAIDQALSAEGNGSTPSSGNITTVVADEICYGMGFITGGTCTYTQPSGWTELIDTGVSFIGICSAYIIKSATGTFPYNPTGTRSDDWLCMIYTYKMADAGSAIKTHDGLADASVKTVDGLVRASVKTRNGLA